MTRQIRRFHQLAEGAARQRPDHEQGPGDMSVAPDGAALQIDIDAEIQGIAAGETCVVDLPEKRICFESCFWSRSACSSRSI